MIHFRQDFGVQNEENEALHPRIEEPYYDVSRSNVRVSSGAEQKIVFGLIVFIAFFALILGFYGYAKNIRSPFLREAPTDETSVPDFASAVVGATAETEAQKTKDTDGDGLSDYDELKVYNTSPYIEDSDSDGYSDKNEVDAGYDPNCPKGRDCGNVLVPPPSATPTPEDIPNFLPGVTGIDQSAFLSGNATPKDIRSLLAQLGMTADQISQLSDEQVQKLYQDTLGQVQSDFQNNSVSGTPSASPDIAGGTAKVDPQQFENLTPDEIRALLLKGGVSEEQIGGLSDEQLMQIYQATLSKIKSQ